MNVEAYPIQCGTKLIENIWNPKASEIDLDHIEHALRGIVRYSGHQKALTVHQHRKLVAELAAQDKMPEEVVWWAEHHDDHEGIIGDIVSPLKRLISHRTNILEIVETRLDIAICEARGVDYPNWAVRERVDHYDKLAATIEWVHCMGETRQAWNVDIPEDRYPNGLICAMVNYARSMH